MLEIGRTTMDTNATGDYASLNSPEHDAEARRRGVSGSTGNPRDLFQRVVAILSQGV